MKTSLVLLAALLCAAALVGACGEDDPAVEDRNAASVSSSTRPAAATCTTVRADLDRLRETIGIPHSVDDAKAMITDELDEVERLLQDVDDLSSHTTGPLKDSVRQAMEDVRSAVESVVASNFGNAQNQLQQANDDLAARIRSAGPGLQLALSGGESRHAVPEPANRSRSPVGRISDQRSATSAAAMRCNDASVRPSRRDTCIWPSPSSHPTSR